MSKPKLRTYATFKDDLSVEGHLKCQLQKWKRALISRLRCGVLSLEIERGRYSQTEANLRTCKLCLEAPETEFHFLFECNSLNELRQSLTLGIPELDMLNNHSDKFKNSAKCHILWQTM